MQIDMINRSKKEERREGEKERGREDGGLNESEERVSCIGTFSDALKYCYYCGNHLRWR